MIRTQQARFSCPVVLIAAVSLVLAWSTMAHAQTFTEFDLPAPGSQPNGIITGPDGNLWFTEIANNKIGRITPAGVITEFQLPLNGQGQSSQPIAIVVGPDGALWFTMSSASRIGRITTAGALTFFITPTAGPGGQGIAVGSDGNIWFTEIAANKIGRLTIATGIIDEFGISTPNSRPARIALGPDGNLWFTESQTNPPANKIGRITKAGAITEFPVPTANSEPWGIAGTYADQGLIVFTERAAGKIGAMDMTGQVVVEIPTPTAGSEPVKLNLGPDGNIWFTELAGGAIARVHNGTSVTEFPIPTSGGGPAGLTVGPDGAFWFTEQQGNKIGRFVPISSPTQLFAAVLPSSRSVQVGHAATVFASIVNAGPNTAHDCGISPVNFVPLASGSFQTTDPATNAPVGSPNTPVDIPAQATQTFVLAFTPGAPFPPTEVRLGFACKDANAAPIVNGVDTALLSSSATPTPDVVALGATLSNDGIVNIPGVSGTGVFAVASVNVGAGASITVSADTGGANVPVSLSVCQTDPTSGACFAVPAGSVTTQIAANATPTFGIFAAATGTAVPFDPAKIRLFVRFKDAGGATRGSTSAALRTQ